MKPVKACYTENIKYWEHTLGDGTLVSFGMIDNCIVVAMTDKCVNRVCT